MKNGDTATLVQPTITGEIVQTRWNNERDCKEHLLRWTEEDGSVQERWFDESQLAAA